MIPQRKVKYSRIVTAERMNQAIHHEKGWCISCEDFTCHGVGEQTGELHCPQCGRQTLFGAVEAYMQGYFNVPDFGLHCQTRHEKGEGQ